MSNDRGSRGRRLKYNIPLLIADGVFPHHVRSGQILSAGIRRGKNMKHRNPNHGGRVVAVANPFPKRSGFSVRFDSLGGRS